MSPDRRRSSAKDTPADRPDTTDQGAPLGPQSGDHTDVTSNSVPDDRAESVEALRGADLARAALEAARSRNAAARTTAGRAARRDKGSGTEVRRLRRRRWSGPGDDRARDPQRVGDVARGWIAKNDTGGDVTRAQLFAQWADIVGNEIADHAQPVSLVDGELTVQAESTAWATQLRYLAAGMVKKINAALGHGTVRRIRAQGPAAPSWRFGNRHVPGRGPRDTYG